MRDQRSRAERKQRKYNGRNKEERFAHVSAGVREKAEMKESRNGRVSRNGGEQEWKREHERKKEFMGIWDAKNLDTPSTCGAHLG